MGNGLIQGSKCRPKCVLIAKNSSINKTGTVGYCFYLNKHYDVRYKRRLISFVFMGIHTSLPNGTERCVRLTVNYFLNITCFCSRYYTVR